MEKKIVLFVLIDQFADWEYSPLAAQLNDPEKPDRPYEVKTVGVMGDIVISMGGFKVKTDYRLDSVPNNYAAVVLVGGMTWRTQEAEPIAALIKQARERGVPIGSLCDSTVFMGKHGFLNDVKHTSNFLNDIKASAGEAYTNVANYQKKDVVSDGGIVTANGQAPYEFAYEMLKILDAMPKQEIDLWYKVNKIGLTKAAEKFGWDKEN